MATLVMNAHDIGPANVLFQRYDSFSTSSGSKRSSITSTESAHSSSSLRSDRTRQRRNNVTNALLNSNTLSEDKSRSNILSDSNKNENDDTCLFCNTIVNERQYYMWQSNYTKSSFCARCKEENKSLQYISYWGTSDYQIGSWRKRYRDGRSSDIDLTPLLEVLDRIDLIDTSICGVTSKSNHTVFIPNPTNDKADETCPKPVHIGDVDYKLAERRHRRLLNRETLTKDTVTGLNITQNSQEKNSHNAIENSEIFEYEHVRTIAPLVIMQVNEIIDQREFFNTTHPRNEIRSDGQTSYEEFIAGLDKDSNIHRTSTSEYDLVDVVKSSNKRIDQQQSEHTDNSPTVRPNVYCCDNNYDKKLDNGNSAYINTTNNNDKITICDTNGNIDDNFKTSENKQTKHDCRITKPKLRNEINEVPQCINKQINQNQDSVLGYKRKSLKPSNRYKAHCVARRRSKTEIEYKIPESVIESEEANVEELSFKDKRRRFEMMQSTDCEQKRVTPGGSLSRYAKSRSNSHDNKATKGEGPRIPKIIIQTNDFPNTTIDCGFSEDTNNAAVRESNSEEAILLGENDPFREDGIEKLDTFETFEREDSNIEKFTQNKNQTYADSRKTQLLKKDDDISQSDSDSEYSEDSSSNNNAIDLDISTTISTTDSSSQRLSLSFQTEITKQDYDSSKILAHYKNVHISRHSSRRSWRQELMQQDREQTENRTDDETSDVPHIERIKKKLGRIRNDGDNESDENGNCVELDVSDNEQMELSWRTRGYNADFFMSRQSVTGSEILDRYNRALSKRRIRKKSRSKDCSSRTSVDLDELISEAREPNTRKTGENVNGSDDVDPISNSSHIGVNPVALKEALNRAAACSKRLSRRLRKQLNENSCDSSS